MFKIAQQLSATTACLVLLFVNTPAASLAQEASGNSSQATSALRIRGGTQVLGAATLDSLASLKVSRGATAVIDFGGASHLKLPGNLVNRGNLFVGSSNQAVTSAQISAANIVNGPRALLSSILPNGGVGGFTTSVANFDLVLSAAQNILNQGTIRSSGNLTMNAGGSIINAAGAAGFSPVMQAVNNVNLQAANIVNGGLIAAQLGTINAYTSQLVNSGTVQARSGSIQIANLSGNALAVDNTLGLIAARNAILMETLGPDEQSKASLSVSGGTLSAEDVSFVSPDGRVAVDADQIDGNVHVSGGTAGIGVRQGNLDLADIHVTGDPIFFAQNGSLDLSGLFSSNPTFSTGGGDFVALASRDITAPTAPTNATIDTTSGSGPGGAIVMAAGVNFSVDTSQVGCSTCSGFYSIGGPNSTGGNISLPTVKLLTNNNISLTARSLGGTVGSVTIGSLHTMGSGNVTVAADLAISSSAIDTSAVSSGNGGSIFLSAQTLGPAGAGPLSVSANGAGTGNGGSISLFIFNTLGAPGAGPISVSTNGAGTGNGGSISLFNHTLGAPGAGPISLSANGAGTGSGGSISFMNFGRTSAAPGEAPISLSANGGTTGNGGTLSVFATGESDIAIGSEAGNLSMSATGGSPGSASGNGGSIVLLTFGNLTVDPGAINVSPLGANGTGGGVNFAVARTGNTEHDLIFVKPGVINASGVGNGSGGFFNFDGGTLKVTAAGPVALAANGGNTGNGGRISIRSTVTEAIGSNNIAIGSGPGNLIISATGGSTGSASGNGGIVRLLNNGGNLTIDPASLRLAPLGTNGNGGSVFLSVSPQGAAPGGNLNLVEGGILNTSGVGNGNGGTIYFDASKLQVTAPSPVTLAANGGSTGNGGNISVFLHGTANNLVVGPGAGNLIISATGGTPGSFSGNGGSVRLSNGTTGSSLTVDPASLSVAPLGTNGNGGSIDFALPFFPSLPYVTSSILVNGGVINCSGVGSGNGGSLSLSAQTLQIAATGPVALTANGGSTGNGGNISLSAATLQITAQGPVTVAANGGGGAGSGSGTGSGGNISVSVATLHVTAPGPVAFTANGGGAGSGGNISISAATLQITAPGPVALTANGGSAGNGGVISVEVSGDNSIAADVAIGSEAGDFILSATGGSPGSACGNGGEISITSGGVSITSDEFSGGNLTVDPAFLTVAPLGTSGNGGSVFLAARVAAIVDRTTILVGGNLNFVEGGVINASGVGNGNGGTIRLEALALQVNKGPLTLAADGAGSGSGGGVAVGLSRDLELGPGSHDLIVANSGGQLGGQEGIVNVNVDNLTIDERSQSVVSLLNPNDQIIAENLTFQGASLNNNGTIVVFQAFNAISSGSPITITNSGSIFSGIYGGSFSITANGSSATLNNEGVITTIGQIRITSNGGSAVITGGGSLDAGDGLSVISHSGPVDVSQGSISGVVTGSADTYFKVATTSSGISAGNISTNGGSISLLAGTGVLSLADGKTLNATEGNVILQNLDSTYGSIAIGSNAQILTSVKNTNLLGDIYLVVGAIPDSPVTGTTPSNVNVHLENGGMVYFGANPITVLGSNNNFWAIGSKIVISNGGSSSSSILFKGGNYLYADPLPSLQQAPAGATANIFTGKIYLPDGSLWVPPSVEPPAAGATQNRLTEQSMSRLPVPTGAIGILNGTTISGNTLAPAGNTFTQVKMPNTAVGPFNLIPVPSSSSSDSDYSDPNASADTDNDDSDLVLVSLVQPTALTSVFKNGIHTISYATATIKHNGQADLKVDKTGALLLNSGSEILIIASRDTLVEAGLAQVSIRNGTIAALSKDGGSVVVRSLYETRGNSVTVYVNSKHSLRLAAGHEVVLDNNHKTMQATLQDQLVGRRKLTHHDLSCGVKVTSCEFSLPALLQTSRILRKMAESNDQGDRAITGKLTKMAACLHILGASRGAYTSGGRLLGL